MTRQHSQRNSGTKEQLTAQRTEHIKEHEAIKTAIQTATAPLLHATPQGRAQVASWAQVAARAGPPPGHVTPPDSLLSSDNSSILTAYKGREVIVKLLDHASATEDQDKYHSARDT